MPPSRRVYRVFLQFWPDTPPAGPGAGAAANTAFDRETEIAAAGGLPAAAAAALRLAARQAGLAPPPAPRSAGLELVPPDLDLSRRPPGAPISLWRAQDGWILVAASEPTTWRTVCMTFLTQRLAERCPAAGAWADPEVNALATTVLDTHKAADAVGTCLTYGVPAAVAPGWTDREAPSVSKALSERLAWAALVDAGPAGS